MSYIQGEIFFYLRYIQVVINQKGGECWITSFDSWQDGSEAKEEYTLIHDKKKTSEDQDYNSMLKVIIICVES